MNEPTNLKKIVRPVLPIQRRDLRHPFDLFRVGQIIISAKHADMHTLLSIDGDTVTYQKHTEKPQKKPQVFSAQVSEVRPYTAVSEARLFDFPNLGGAGFEMAACSVFNDLGVANIRRYLQGDGRESLKTPERYCPSSAELLRALNAYSVTKAGAPLDELIDEEINALMYFDIVNSDWTDFFPQYKMCYRMSLQYC